MQHIKKRDFIVRTFWLFVYNTQNKKIEFFLLPYKKSLITSNHFLNQYA